MYNNDVAEFAALIEKHPELWEAVREILTSEDTENG